MVIEATNNNYCGRDAKTYLWRAATARTPHASSMKDADVREENSWDARRVDGEYVVERNLSNFTLCRTPSASKLRVSFLLSLSARTCAAGTHHSKPHAFKP